MVNLGDESCKWLAQIKMVSEAVAKKHVNLGIKYSAQTLMDHVRYINLIHIKA